MGGNVLPPFLNLDMGQQESTTPWGWVGCAGQVVRTHLDGTGPLSSFRTPKGLRRTIQILLLVEASSPVSPLMSVL